MKKKDEDLFDREKIEEIVKNVDGDMIDAIQKDLKGLKRYQLEAMSIVLKKSILKNYKEYRRAENIKGGIFFFVGMGLATSAIILPGVNFFASVVGGFMAGKGAKHLLSQRLDSKIEAEIIMKECVDKEILNREIDSTLFPELGE